MGTTTAVVLGAAPADAEGIGDCASSIARDPTAFGVERLGDDVSRVARTAPGAIPALTCRWLGLLLGRLRAQVADVDDPVPRLEDRRGDHAVVGRGLNDTVEHGGGRP